MNAGNDEATRAGVASVVPIDTTLAQRSAYPTPDNRATQSPPITTADIDALGLTSTGANFDNNLSNVVYVLGLLAARGVFGVRMEVADGPGHHDVGPSRRFPAPRYFYGSERGAQGPDPTRLAVLIQRLDPRFRKITPNVAGGAAEEFMRQSRRTRA